MIVIKCFNTYMYNLKYFIQESTQYVQLLHSWTEYNVLDTNKKVSLVDDFEQLYKTFRTCYVVTCYVT